MRKNGRSSVVVVGAVALGVAVVAAIWLRADASAGRSAELQTLCEKARAYHRRAAATAELIAIDTSAFRKALKELADSRDAQLAAWALAAIGRAKYSGAKTKLADVVGDSKRPDIVRGTALVAHCRAEKADGRSWADVEAIVSSADQGDLCAVSTSTRSRSSTHLTDPRRRIVTRSESELTSTTHHVKPRPLTVIVCPSTGRSAR